MPENLKHDTSELLGEIYEALSRRLMTETRGQCPAAVCEAVLSMCNCHTCGKCVPCRVGLKQLQTLVTSVLDGQAQSSALSLMERTAKVIYETADCSLGQQSALFVLSMLKAFPDDFQLHLNQEGCICDRSHAVPCRAYCPAHVDVPGYVGLVEAGRYADAVRLIRQDNPFPLACSLVCEHPCETACRRNGIDAAINIRGLKKAACDNAGHVDTPQAAPATGKKIAVIGAGPSGLTAAYYLKLMGHEVTVYEQRRLPGGMLQYGIPEYRLPKQQLQAEISTLENTGFHLITGVSVGTDISIKEIRSSYDAVYVAIGAHGDKKLRIESEEHCCVMPAVRLLRKIGDGEKPDFSGKRVVVVGGGNVAMDAARTSVRLGADRVDIVYRRRKEDMTAQKEEIEGAMQEGCEVLELRAPVKVESDGEGKLKGLYVQPQIIGPVENGRPKPQSADAPMQLIPCDLIIVAIGQDIQSKPFETAGIQANRGRVITDANGAVPFASGVFAGGDCVSGPATVIKAVAAGKQAARSIDSYLGYHHVLASEVRTEAARFRNIAACGRANLTMRDACERKKDFDPIEGSFTRQEALQEANRCLHCDHFGCGSFRGGRVEEW